MSLHKHWTDDGRKEMVRDEGTADHEPGNCADDCPYCQRYSFDRLHDAFVTSFKKAVPRP